MRELYNMTKDGEERRQTLLCLYLLCNLWTCWDSGARKILEHKTRMMGRRGPVLILSFCRLVKQVISHEGQSAHCWVSEVMKGKTRLEESWGWW